jgi:hypothetical protein
MQTIMEDTANVVDSFREPEADLNEEQVARVETMLKEAACDGVFDEFENSYERQGAMLAFVGSRYGTEQTETTDVPAELEPTPEPTEEDAQPDEQTEDDKSEDEEVAVEPDVEEDESKENLNEEGDQIIKAIAELMQEPWMDGHEELGEQLFDVAKQAQEDDADMREALLVAAAELGADVPQWMVESEPSLQDQAPEAEPELEDDDEEQTVTEVEVLPPEPELTNEQMNNLLVKFVEPNPMFMSLTETVQLLPVNGGVVPLVDREGQEIVEWPADRHAGPLPMQVIDLDDKLAQAPQTRSIFVQEKHMQREIETINQLYDETMEYLRQYRERLEKVNRAVQQRLD